VRSPRGAVLLLGVAAVVACRRAPREGPAASTETLAPAGAPAAAPGRPAVAAAPNDDFVGEPPESNPTSEMVSIRLTADPARKARVFWGRKDLGLAPLELKRPRGSGPVDLVVVTPGALTLHTRAYTDRDDKLALRLYAEREAPGLLGYHAAPETPPQAGPDAAKRNAGQR
jgi:hypothetical protein